MVKKIAILQSNYIPWKGYFDLIAAVDEFILFDDVQYTRRDWRNRNKIKTAQGIQWLTIPVKSKGKYLQSIRDTELNGTQWASDHWKALFQNYHKAPCFKEVSKWVKDLYFNDIPTNLSQLNFRFINEICNNLGIKTKITWSWDYPLTVGKSERLVDLCLAAGGAEYISGPSAKSYIDESAFLKCGVKLTWFDYLGYPEYPQLCGDFVHGLTILDLLFNCGKDSPQYMRYVR